MRSQTLRRESARFQDALTGLSIYADVTRTFWSNWEPQCDFWSNCVLRSIQRNPLCCLRLADIWKPPRFSSRKRFALQRRARAAGAIPLHSAVSPHARASVASCRQACLRSLSVSICATRLGSVPAYPHLVQTSLKTSPSCLASVQRWQWARHWSGRQTDRSAIPERIYWTITSFRRVEASAAQLNAFHCFLLA